MDRNTFAPIALILAGLILSSFGYGQITDTISGTWVRSDPGGAGCPALALYPDNRPTVFALTYVAPPNGTTDFALYVLQQNIQDAATGKWENDFPIYNLNQC